MYDVDTAIRLGFHCLTGSEMGEVMRERLADRPSVPFTGLVPGWYLYTAGSAATLTSACQVLVVERVTPSGEQAVVLFPSTEGSVASQGRIHSGSYTGSFTSLDETLEALLGVTHEDVVTGSDAGASVCSPSASLLGVVT